MDSVNDQPQIDLAIIGQITADSPGIAKGGQTDQSTLDAQRGSLLLMYRQ